MNRWQVAAALAGLVAHAVWAQPCPGDLNGDGKVTIDEVLVVVNAALNSCAPPPTLTETVPPTSTLPPTRTPTATRTATITRTPTPTPRFIDNANGTITDTTTQLVWEKKSADGSVHDKDVRACWSMSGSTAPDGAAFTTFLATLNGGRFAGRQDWRLPTIDELQTIVDRGAITPGAPLVAPAFNTNCRPGCSVTQCSCTTPLNYWTATTSDANDQQAWYVLFNTGVSGTGFKTLEFYVRAVRGGQ